MQSWRNFSIVGSSKKKDNSQLFVKKQLPAPEDSHFEGGNKNQNKEDSIPDQMAAKDQDVSGFEPQQTENKRSAQIEFSSNQNPFDHSENVKSLLGEDN